MKLSRKMIVWLVGILVIIAAIAVSYYFTKNKTDKSQPTPMPISTNTQAASAKTEPTLTYGLVLDHELTGDIGDASMINYGSYNIAKKTLSQAEMKLDFGLEYGSVTANKPIQWSSDGSMMAYAYGDQPGMDADGVPNSFKLILKSGDAETVVISDIDSVAIPQWLLLPDKSKLIYVKADQDKENFPRSVYSYDIATKKHSTLVSLENVKNSESELFLSGDKQSVFFFNNQPDGNVRKLFKVSINISTGQITNDQMLKDVSNDTAFLGGFSSSDARVSPNGKLVAYRYVVDANNHEHGIAIYNLETGASNPIFAPGTTRSVNDMYWSSDNKFLAFETTWFGSGDGIGQNVEVDIVNISTKEKIKIDDFTETKDVRGSVRMVGWSPDDSKVAYTKQNSLRVYDTATKSSVLVRDITNSSLIGLSWTGF